MGPLVPDIISPSLNFIVAIYLIVVGITGLWPAILADTGATVLVTLNALRLLAWKPAA